LEYKQDGVTDKDKTMDNVRKQNICPDDQVLWAENDEI
jgi:hypothetical protein